MIMQHSRLAIRTLETELFSSDATVFNLNRQGVSTRFTRG